MIMPTKGQVLTLPSNGNSYEYMETAKDTNGERVVMRATVYQKGPNVPNHIHVLQEETFEVLSGKLTILENGKTRVLSAGESVAFPKNTAHNHFNDHDEAVTYIQTVTPGLDIDYLVETLLGLAADGKAKNGKYGMVQELVVLKYLDSKTYLADMPIGVQKVLMNLVAPIGRLMGYRAIYKKYSGIEK
jgi:quercetin dioxygenase-like cupin family protein